MPNPETFALKGDIVYSDSLKTLATYPGHYLVCEDGHVAGVYRELPAQYAGVCVDDHSGKLVIPGLVDLHLHAPQYANCGLGMDKELLDWLEAVTFPEEAKLSDPGYAEKAYEIFTEALLRTATTRACIFATVHVPATLQLMEKLEAAGLVTYVGKVNMDRNTPPDLCEAGTEASLAATRDWLGQCARFTRTHPILTPRFIGSCTDDLMRGLAGLQRETCIPVQSHLSENLSEIAWIRELCPTSKSYADAYASLRLLGGDGCPTVMAHCVHNTPDEVELLKTRGVYVAHCPTSNIDLSSGVAPIRHYLDLDMRVGLGTDVSGGFSLSILHAMADAIQASKMRWRLLDDTLAPLTLPEVFYLATKGGGEFFGKVGSFEAGYEFDAVVLDDSHLRTPRPLTLENRLERAVYLLDDTAGVHAKYAAGTRVV